MPADLRLLDDEQRALVSMVREWAEEVARAVVEEPQMRRRKRTAVVGLGAVVFFGLTFAACTSPPVDQEVVEEGSPHPDRQAARPRPTTLCRAHGAANDLLLIAGKDPLNADLFVTSLCDWRSERVTPYSRFSSIDAAGGTVVVATARFRTDHVELLEGDRLISLPNGKRPMGFTPVVDPMGTVAFTSYDNRPKKYWKVTTVDRSGHTSVPYRSANALDGVALGPGKQLFVIESTPHHPWTRGRREIFFTFLDERGQRSRLDIPIKHPLGLAWDHSAGLLAIGGRETGIVIDVRTGARVAQLPGGWFVDGFRPGAPGVLLVLNGKLNRVGLVDVSRPRPKVTRLPAPRLGSLVEAAWGVPAGSGE